MGDEKLRDYGKLALVGAGSAALFYVCSYFAMKETQNQNPVKETLSQEIFQTRPVEEIKKDLDGILDGYGELYQMWNNPQEKPK